MAQEKPLLNIDARNPNARTILNRYRSTGQANSCVAGCRVNSGASPDLRVTSSSNYMGDDSMRTMIAIFMLACLAMAQDPQHQQGVETRGDQAMGFSQEMTTHYFLLTKDGGVIEAEADNPTKPAGMQFGSTWSTLPSYSARVTSTLPCSSTGRLHRECPR